MTNSNTETEIQTLKKILHKLGNGKGIPASQLGGGTSSSSTFLRGDQTWATTEADIAVHAALTATHGVTGVIVGTTDNQTLTTKTLTSPTIQGTVGAGTGLTMPAFTLGGVVTAYAGSGLVRTAAYVVTATDASAIEKVQTDSLCDGVNDEVNILAAIS